MYPLPLYSVFTQPVQFICFCVIFCLYGVKIPGKFKEKGHKKRKEWPRIILCISLFTIDVRHMLLLPLLFFFFLGFFLLIFCQPTVNLIRAMQFHQPVHLVKYIQWQPLMSSFGSSKPCSKNEIIKMETSNINQQTKLYTV